MQCMQYSFQLILPQHVVTILFWCSGVFPFDITLSDLVGPALLSIHGVCCFHCLIMICILHFGAIFALFSGTICVIIYTSFCLCCSLNTGVHLMWQDILVMLQPVFMMKTLYDLLL